MLGGLRWLVAAVDYEIDRQRGRMLEPRSEFLEALRSLGHGHLDVDARRVALRRVAVAALAWEQRLPAREQSTRERLPDGPEIADAA